MLNEPGTWGLPGGHLEEGEGALQGALRECEEEMGSVPEHRTLHLDVANGYATFFARLPRFFDPVLNEEHDDFRWFRVEDASLVPNLHPAMPRLIEIVRKLKT